MRSPENSFYPQLNRSTESESLLHGKNIGSRRQLYNEEFYSDEIKEKLNDKELRMLDELTRASRRISDLYNLQKRESFYPAGLKNEEFNNAADLNPDLKSPYTYVERDETGNLIAVPIHKVFADKISEKGIIDSLKKAANIAIGPEMRDTEMYAYLRSRAEAFKSGNWESTEKLWLSMTQLPKVFIVIGPYDTYLDKQRGIKFAFQSWVGVLNEKSTKKSQEFTNMFLAQHELATGIKSPKVTVRVDDTVIKSGQAAEYEWTGNSLPCQPELRRDFGSVFTIFKPTFDDKLYESRIPAYRSVIHPSKRAGVTDEQVAEANEKKYLGHETVHAFVPLDAQVRLGGHTQWVKELDCDLTSLEINFDLAKSRREQEILFASFFANGFVEYQDYTNDEKRIEYYLGAAIALNYCLKNQAIEINNGTINWENADHVVDSLKDLSKNVRHILVSGNKKDARNLSDSYYVDDFYKELKHQPELPAFLQSSN